MDLHCYPSVAERSGIEPDDPVGVHRLADGRGHQAHPRSLPPWGGPHPEWESNPPHSALEAVSPALDHARIRDGAPARTRTGTALTGRPPLRREDLPFSYRRMVSTARVELALPVGPRVLSAVGLPFPYVDKLVPEVGVEPTRLHAGEAALEAAASYRCATRVYRDEKPEAPSRGCREGAS